MNRFRSATRLSLSVALALAVTAPVGGAAAAVTQGPGCARTGTTVSCEFWATSGSLPLPGGNVDVMGYSDTAAGAPLLPGPAIVAEAGDTVAVTLHNALAGQSTGLLFQEQAIGTDTGGAAPGATKTYSFIASHPGTYLYEASPFVPTTGGGGSQYQAAMGMFGALVVRPATAGRAYDTAASAYDAEHLVVVGELDKEMTAANAHGFDMRKFAPDYFLINGKVSPSTDALAAAAREKVLLRIVNGGIMAHSIGLLGVDQTVVGEDGNPLPNPRHVVAETVASGQTSDVVVDLPADASGKYALYDAGMAFNNASASGMGGMVTFLDVAPSGTPPDTFGPGTTSVALAGTTLTAETSDAATGGATVTEAEYFVDAVGTSGSGTPMTGTFGAPAVSVSATIPGLTPGSHALYVHSRDGLGNWGPVSSVLHTTADATGPLTRSLGLSPSPTNGSRPVALTATGDDKGRGGSDVVGGEYAIDAGAPVAIAPTTTGPVAALDTTIPAATVAALAEGVHTVSVRSRDSAGNWGAPATRDLLVDKTGPTATQARVSPALTNGRTGVNTSVSAVRVTVKVTDQPANGVASDIQRAEGFLAGGGADGQGFPLVPSDGVADSGTEAMHADIPLTTVASLPQGTHTLRLHGRDVAGNWGPQTTTDVVVDRTGPAVTNLTASPDPTNTAATNNTTFALTATAIDNLTAVSHAEWFAGADPGEGHGTPVAVAGGPGSGNLSATVDFMALGWPDGDRVISMRARDAAGNWGAPATLTVAIRRSNVIAVLSLGIQTARSTAGITDTGGRISFTRAANSDGQGGAGMNVRLAGSVRGGAAAAFTTTNAPAAEPAHHARFFLNPNGSDPGGLRGAGVVILAGYGADNGGGKTRFEVRYRKHGARHQVRLKVWRVNGVSSTRWHTVESREATRVGTTWRAGRSVAASLTLNGVMAETLGGLDTGAASRIESVRFGVQGLAGRRSGSLFLDGLILTRRT